MASSSSSNSYARPLSASAQPQRPSSSTTMAPNLHPQQGTTTQFIYFPPQHPPTPRRMHQRHLPPPHLQPLPTSLTTFTPSPPSQPPSSLSTPKQPTPIPRPTDFHQFQKIPLEIQYMIFVHAKPSGRHIEIHYSPSRQRYTTDTPIPAILQVNRASRNELKLHFSHLNLSISTQGNNIKEWLYNREDMPISPITTIPLNTPAGQTILQKFSCRKTLSFETYIDWETDSLSVSPNHFQDRGNVRIPFHFKDLVGCMMYNTQIIRNLRVLSMEAKTFVPKIMAVPLARLHALKMFYLIVGDACCGKVSVQREGMGKGVSYLVEKKHERLREIRVLEEPEENLGFREKREISRLGRDNVCDGKNEKFSYCVAMKMYEELNKAICEEMRVESMRPDDRKKGVRMNWDGAEFEIVTMDRKNHGDY